MRQKIIFFCLLGLYVILLLDIVSIVGLFKGIFLSGKNHLKNIFVAYISLYFFLIFLSSILSEKKFKIILYVITIPIAILNGAIVWYVLYYGGLPMVDDISTILATNAKESSEFIVEIYDYKVILALFISVINVVLIYFLKPYQVKNKIIVALSLVVSIVIFAFTFDKRWVHREIAILDIIGQFNQTVNDREIFFKMLEETEKKEVYFENINNKLNNNENQHFILIISESQNKYHFSIYGYDKNTTPYLNSVKNELYIFSDVVAAALYTNTSVEKMITFSDNHNKLEGYEAGNIIRFFKDAGFKTYWLSNQYFLGKYDNLYSAIAYRADEAIFLNQVSGDLLEADNYDTALIPYINEILKDNSINKKFIVVHLFGSHTPFILRYPNDFGSFKYGVGMKDLLGDISKEKYIATYDNSIEFTDYFMKLLMEEVKKLNSQSYVMFLSDHGHDVYDMDPTKIIPRSGHAANVQSYYRVPFFIWFSDEYKRAYPEVISRVNKSLDKKYQLDRVIHTILDLSRLSHSKYVDSDSIISDNYIEKERTINGNKID